MKPLFLGLCFLNNNFNMSCHIDPGAARSVSCPTNYLVLPEGTQGSDDYQETHQPKIQEWFQVSLRFQIILPQYLPVDGACLLNGYVMFCSFVVTYEVSRGKSFSLGKFCCSVAWSCPILCNPMDCSTPGFPILHHLLELAQTHVLWDGDAANHLILCCPLLLCLQSFPPSGSFPALHIRWPKYWSFNISPYNEYSGLISFSIHWFDLPAVQGTLKSLLQYHSSKLSVL